MPAPRRPQRGRRRVRKNIPIGQAHIKTSFNNTIVSLTDKEGNVIAWESAGGAGFQRAGEVGPFGAEATGGLPPRQGLAQGLPQGCVYVKGPCSGGEAGLRSLPAARLAVTRI